MLATENNKKLKKFISQERIWICDLRLEMNKQLDSCLKRLDDLELKVLKEEEAEPQSLTDETLHETTDADTANVGGPEKRI